MEAMAISNQHQPSDGLLIAFVFAS